MAIKSNGLAMTVVVIFCWLMFVSIYSAFKHDPVFSYSSESHIVAEGCMGGEEYTLEPVNDLTQVHAIESYGILKSIDDNYELMKDSRDAAEAVYDLCVELKMERCL